MIERRQLLRLGLMGPAGLAVGCGDDGAGGGETPAPDAQQFDCLLTPEQTAGPFYFDPALVRRNIVEDRAGTPLRIALDIVGASDCQALLEARVDLWHCDAGGLYSGYPAQGDDGDVDTSGMTFLRGSQVSDASGRVEFVSVFPGWYPGRAVHLHFKVFIDRTTAATGQLYFADDTTDLIHSGGPYAARGQRDTRNTDETRAGVAGTLVEANVDGEGYRAALRIGILT